MNEVMNIAVKDSKTQKEMDHENKKIENNFEAFNQKVNENFKGA